MFSSLPELRPEQVAAVETLGTHVSVTAGPGAGKTKVLVERYLHILGKNQHLNIDQIVAITFTNRAANEMRKRLRARLDTILEDAPPKERPRWMNYKRTLDGAIITTIHGFCSRLLREFPVEARVDPQFVLLDEHQAATLLENAVEESLTEFINAGHEAVSRLTAGVGRSRLATTLAELYRSVRGQGLAINNLIQQATDSHCNWDQYLAAVADVDALVTELISTRGLPGKTEEKRYELEQNWPRMRQLLLDEQLPLSDYCREIAELREAARPGAGVKRIKELVQNLDEIFWGEKQKPYGQAPGLRFDVVAKEYACEALQVLRSIDERLEQTKRQLAALDYDDLQIRALKLLEQPEVLLRAARRYKYFLVDEFQDTNPLQRDLMERLALANRKDSNLFIVGDPKQSVYGFRGADVGVFQEMSDALILAAGTALPLQLNFRSQPQLIVFFNLLFARLFKPADEINASDLQELGYVKHEHSIAELEQVSEGPLVELLVDTVTSDNESWKARLSTRERDAQQLANRVTSLVNSVRSFSSPPVSESDGVGSAVVSAATNDAAPQPPKRIEYRDIALLFRAMTDVPVYESVFRRANIPYQTVLGRGFYEREEITDLIQLLRFLDNRTDELALAAVLRSPLCGISDNALLALRIGPKIGETASGAVPQSRRSPRKLFSALRSQAQIDFIESEERSALDRATSFLQSLIEKRNRYPVGDLLRFAVKRSEYLTVVAANFDGGQRLANVEKLFTLAERFERSGAHLIRDFVKYVRDFEAIGSRESEGQLDEAANAVTFMTIHQAKGLEFPVVIIPDLQRIGGPRDNWFLLDRYLGLTLKVPDGRGNQVTGCTFKKFSDRARQRELFESLRLLYVAATRAQDRLILSGTADDLTKLSMGRDCWLKWIWQALDLENTRQSGTITIAPTKEEQEAWKLETGEASEHSGVEVDFILNLTDNWQQPATIAGNEPSEATFKVDPNQSPVNLFPLLAPVERAIDAFVPRFSVTQLINYRRCPRQYYFDRVLHMPSADEVAVWNNAEAPEPPANLTATLKGAVIHRFCETYTGSDDAKQRLRQSFTEVLRTRQSQLADRLFEIDADTAIEELWPLAQNYLKSDVFIRIEKTRPAVGQVARRFPEDQIGPDDPEHNPCGLWSELSFRLRRPGGLITGTIDKLLIAPAASGPGFDVEIIDFKTNRFRTPANVAREPAGHEVASVSLASNRASAPSPGKRGARQKASTTRDQFAFDFELLVQPEPIAPPTKPPVTDLLEQAEVIAADYHLQMQAYALAVRQLIPNLASTGAIRVTLHFLQPDVEFRLPDHLLETAVCEVALDKAMRDIVLSSEPAEFPVCPATHCRMCNFLDVCPAGREWLQQLKVGGALTSDLQQPGE